MKSSSSWNLVLKFLNFGRTFSAFFSETSFFERKTLNFWFLWKLISDLSRSKTFSPDESCLLGCRSSLRFKKIRFRIFSSTSRWQVSYTDCCSKLRFWSKTCTTTICVANSSFNITATKMPWQLSDAQRTSPSKYLIIVAFSCWKSNFLQISN